MLHNRGLGIPQRLRPSDREVAGVGTARARPLPWKRANFHLSVLQIGLSPDCLLKERICEAQGSQNFPSSLKISDFECRT